MNSKIMYLILFSMLSPLDGQGITEIVNTNGDFFLKITAESLVEIKLSRTWTISPNVPADQWMKKKYPGKEFQMPEKNLINLDSLFPQKKPELADETFLYNEFESPKDGFAKIGIGCDWWFEAACNGEVCHSTMKDGNRGSTYSPEDNIFLIKIRKGRNLLAVKVRRGLASWSFSCSELHPVKKLLRPFSESDRYIHDRLPEDFFTKIEKGDFVKPLYPVFADRKAWEKARKSPYADWIIKEADLIKDKEIPQLYYSNYNMYNVNGDRVGFERPYFHRRKNLALLTLAMCLTGDKEKYMSRVIDYTIAITEEWTWCIPAHSTWSKNHLKYWEFSDLFCSETGAAMAQLHAILADEFDKEIAGLSELIRKKTLERTVYQVLYSGHNHWWYSTLKPANWTVWCGYSNLFTTLTLEQDPVKRVFAVKKFLEIISRLITYNPDNGYSPEGPTYYNQSYLMMFRSFYFLHKLIPGSMDKIWTEPKIKAMIEFIVNLRMGDKYQLSYADSRPNLTPSLSFALPAGKILQSPELLELAVNGRYSLGGNCATLRESLALLFDQPEELPTKSSPGRPVSLFENSLVILRTTGFTASFKGGHNDEPHNHNDLGHFCIFHKGKPIIVDAGTGAYSRIHFSPERYTLWNTRGSGHNAPVFGKYEQVWGNHYTAGFTLKENKIRGDLSKAYPAEAGVKSFIRELDFSETEVTVEDRFELTKKLPAVITLFCAVPPTVKEKHLIQIGKVTLKLENIAFDSMEEIPESKVIWGKPLTALRLKTESEHYKLIFQQEKK